tara:strand:+ start:3962 stop:4150 length:189 start_codon:yes stop_codon:yes gene_type:complete
MSNYPDDFPDHLLDEDMDGVEKLSCGCYEECCECPKCKWCGEILDDEGFHSVGPNECEDEEE